MKLCDYRSHKTWVFLGEVQLGEVSDLWQGSNTRNTPEAAQLLRAVRLPQMAAGSFGRRMEREVRTHQLCSCVWSQAPCGGVPSPRQTLKHFSWQGCLKT